MGGDPFYNDVDVLDEGHTVGGPLAGIRVLELTQVFVGPYTGVNLADLGADVVKIEPPEGDSVRHAGSIIPTESKGFHAVNRGKRGIVLDLKQPAAQAVVHRLITAFDVFVVNARPGVPARLRVDYGTLRQFRPDLVYQETTAFGYQPPGRDWAGSDIIAQAYSGLMAAEGKTNADGAPEEIRSTPFVDFATGLAGAMGICAALYRRAMTGQGEYIEATLFGSALSFQATRLARQPVHDEVYERPLRERMRAASEAGASYQELVDAYRTTTGGAAKTFRMYYGGYRTKGGAIILGGVNRANQQQVRAVLGITDDPATEPDYDPSDPATNERLDALRERMQQIFLTKTADEWMELLLAAGAPASKVNFPEDMADNVQVEAMGFLRDYDHPLTGPERLIGPVISWRNAGTGDDRPSPPLGGHTDEVLTEAGFSLGELTALRAQAAIA